jgi:hypothetical protein
VNSIKDRSKNLDGMLSQRPTRDRLQRLNVIKEDENLAPVLIATRDKLKRQQDKVNLSTTLWDKILIIRRTN